MWYPKALLIISISSLALQANAQKELQVKDEPRHKNVFENPYLRILDVYIKPADTTLYHKHSTASVIVVFTKTNMSTQVSGESAVSGHTIPGSISYVAFDEKPVFHRVMNHDTSMFHVMDIEILGKNPGAPGSVFRESDIIPAWQENRVNAYTLYADQGQIVHKTPSASPLLLICVTGSGAVTIGSNPNPIQMNVGSFAWIERLNPFQVTGQSNPGSGYVLLDLNQ